MKAQVFMMYVYHNLNIFYVYDRIVDMMRNKRGGQKSNPERYNSRVDNSPTTQIKGKLKLNQLEVICLISSFFFKRIMINACILFSTQLNAQSVRHRQTNTLIRRFVVAIYMIVRVKYKRVPVRFCDPWQKIK